MAVTKKRPPAPSDDKRWKIVEGVMRRNGFKGSGLIEVLHSVQEHFGCLDADSLRYVATAMRVPPSKVYGVATFYHHFTLKPSGEHVCTVCTGTACYIKGASALLDHLRQRYEVAPGETTEDGKVSVLTARCLGSCSLAPAAVFDGEVKGHVDPETLDAHMESWVNA